ncbi:MAG: 23S rRNA pseudouridine1911/1915/1917 synthase [Planctomycetota bacterium]|jgi:23S rRNA pseudouridine1911/1915/1917 synthase
MSERLHVEEPEQLLSFLRSRLEGWTVRTLKKRLRFGCILVNGERATRHDHALVAGDQVEVAPMGGGATGSAVIRANSAFTIIYADDDLIVIDKPAGLLSVSTDVEQTRTALALLKESLSTLRHSMLLWPVHRLDRETSGVLIFAKSREMRDQMQANWKQAKKLYLAVVEGYPEPADDVIDQPLFEDRHLNVRVGTGDNCLDAVTRYRTRERRKGRTLLEVKIDTGRRHQIRAHLAWLGNPVVGDRRYGIKGKRLGLHAVELSVPNPKTGEIMTFNAQPPRPFTALLSGDKD